MDEGMSESQGSQETMSDISSVASGSESDSEHDNIDVDEFLRRNRDPKWDALFSDEPVVKPKLSLDERTRLREEKEKERIRLVRERGPALLPEDYVPRPRTPPEKIAEARAARYKAWQEKILQIQGECQTLFEENRRNKRAEYEKFAKLQKEYYPRDYYWKPDPLYYLHLKELGFSKIAIDKALFYTDNTSVKKALEYLKENPNPTELTKQEVMAAGEEVLKRIRPKKHDRLDPAEQTLTKESEMDIDGSQPLVPKNDSPLDGEANGEMKKPEEAATAFVFTVPKPVSKKGKVDISGKSRRGIKRTHSGVALIPPVQQSTSTDVHIQKPSSTEVHIRQRSSSKVHIKQPASTDVHIQGPTSTDVAPPLLVDKGEKLQLKMVLVVNASLLLDAVTLALEVGKVVANISSKLAADPEKYKIMFDEWIKEGHKMWMFRGENSQYLSHEYEVMSETNVIMYLSQCTHYRDIKTPSPSVLGVFGDSRQLQRYSYLPML